MILKKKKKSNGIQTVTCLLLIPLVGVVASLSYFLGKAQRGASSVAHRSKNPRLSLSSLVPLASFLLHCDVHCKCACIGVFRLMVFVQFWPTDEGLIYIAVKSPLFEVVSGGGKSWSALCQLVVMLAHI